MSRPQAQGVLRRVAALLAAQWLGDGLQAVFLLLLARRAVDAYGGFMLAMSLGQILLFCAEFGINQHFMLLLVKREAAPSAVYRQITLLKGALLLLGSVCAAGFCLSQGYPAELMGLMLIIGLSYGVDALVNSYYVVCQSLGRQDVEGRVRGMAALCGYGFGLVALLSGAPPLVAALFKPVETLVGLAVSLPLLRRSWRASELPLWRTLRETWNKTRVFTLMALAAILYNKINIFFLQRHGGARAVAQYSATWQLVDGIASLAATILLGRVLFPLFAKLWVTDPEAFQAKAREQARVLTALALPATFVFMAGAGIIIPLAYGDQYAEAVRIQPWLSLCLLISFLHNLAYYLLLSMGRQTLVLLFFTAGLAVNVILCAALIPGAPLDGAVAAIVLTKAFVAVLTLGACQRAVRLFSLRGLRPALLATAGAGALAWCGELLGQPLAGRALALVPLLANLWTTWRSVSARAVKTAAA
ncbi:MAG: oligosaccharide flippase family protein [Humidesulfovibrio sp.]|nr:oligosaccharide flippase family protein [Humidesulfovibrio sp.]